MKTRYEKEIRNLERELSKSKGGDKELCEEKLFSIQLVTGLTEYYDSSDLICRQQIIGSIFLEKMGFQDGELRTKKANSAVELLCRPPKDLKENKIKKALKIQSFPIWCPTLERFRTNTRKNYNFYIT